MDKSEKIKTTCFLLTTKLNHHPMLTCLAEQRTRQSLWTCAKHASTSVIHLHSVPLVKVESWSPVLCA